MLLRVLITFLIGVTVPAQPGGEKESRTPAQQKINSQLLFEIYRARGEAERKGVPPGDTRVRIDALGRALVDVRADPTPALQKKIQRLGGVVLSTSARDKSIIARIQLTQASGVQRRIKKVKQR